MEYRQNAYYLFNKENNIHTYPFHTCPNPFPVREMLNIHTDRCEQGVNIYVYELIKTK